jgi:uncharacterized membrane protein
MSTLVILFCASGLLLAGLAIPLILRRIPPNGLYGFRVKATMENPEIWYPVNVFAGKWLLGIGLVTTVAAVALTLIPDLGIDEYAYLLLGIWLVIFVIGIGATIRFMKKLIRSSNSMP